MSMRKALSRMKNYFALIYSPPYIALNIAIAVIYYFVFVYLIRLQNYGILLITVPHYLIYALVATSSVMFTIGVYAIRHSLRRGMGASSSTVGTFMALFAGFISGCGCSAPLLYGVTAFGLSIAEVSVASAFIAKYSVAIISAIIAVNVLLILYNSWRISCPVKRKR